MYATYGFSDKPDSTIWVFESSIVSRQYRRIYSYKYTYNTCVHSSLVPWQYRRIYGLDVPTPSTLGNAQTRERASAPGGEAPLVLYMMSTN